MEDFLVFFFFFCRGGLFFFPICVPVNHLRIPPASLWPSKIRPWLFPVSYVKPSMKLRTSWHAQNWEAPECQTLQAARCLEWLNMSLQVAKKRPPYQEGRNGLCWFPFFFFFLNSFFHLAASRWRLLCRRLGKGHWQRQGNAWTQTCWGKLVSQDRLGWDSLLLQVTTI